MEILLFFGWGKHAIPPSVFFCARKKGFFPLLLLMHFHLLTLGERRRSILLSVSLLLLCSLDLALGCGWGGTRRRRQDKGLSIEKDGLHSMRCKFKYSFRKHEPASLSLYWNVVSFLNSNYCAVLCSKVQPLRKYWLPYVLHAKRNPTTLENPFFSPPPLTLRSRLMTIT